MDFEELCKLLTEKYRVDFVIIDKNYKTLNYSEGIEYFSNGTKLKSSDIRCHFFELIGYERDFEKISKGVKKGFELKAIEKNSRYINLYIRKLKSKNFVIFVEDVTKEKKREQKILQNRNMNELMLRKWEKLKNK